MENVIQESESHSYEFSFIVPVKNALPFLQVSLDSINNQTFGNFEVVIIDDGSTDSSLNLIKKNAKANWTVLSNAESKGRPFSRNLAVSFSKGSYLVIHDADDISAPNRLKFLHEIISTAVDKPDVIVGAICNIYNNGKLGRIEKLPTDTNELTLLLEMGSMPFAHPASAIKKRAFQAIGGYPNYLRAQDLAIFINLRNSNFFLDKRVHTFYRRNRILKYNVFVESQKNVNQIRKDLLGISPDPIKMSSWVKSEVLRNLRTIRRFK